MQGQFLLDRIEAVKAQIVVYESAVTSLGTKTILSYTLDTGQSRQTVTYADMGSLQKVLDGLYNSLATLEARAGCGGSVYVRPIF